MSEITLQDLKEELEIAEATGNREAVVLVSRLIEEFEEEGYLEDLDQGDCSNCNECSCR